MNKDKHIANTLLTFIPDYAIEKIRETENSIILCLYK